MQKIFYAVWLGSTIFLQACGGKKTEIAKANSETIPVRVVSLQQESVSQSVTASGQFTTDDEAYLAFKTGGVIQRIFVNEGDPVKKGQLLATLYLTEINAQVQQAALGLEKAQRDYNRVSALYKDSVATLEQMQNAKTALDIAKQQVSAANFNQNYSEIRATESGYVLRKLASEGQVAGPGTPVLQVNGAGNKDWLLKVSVSDRQWNAIRKGDRANVATDAAPGQRLEAEVLRKSEGVDPVTGTFSVSLRLKQKPSGSIAAGLFGKAVIQPSEQVESWSIPYDAVLDGDAGTGYVFITNDNKTAEKVRITIASITENSVLVSAGLENARALIVSGNAYLNDKSPITITR